MFYLIWFQGHQTQTRGVGHLPDALLLISSPNFDICLSVDPRLNSQLSCTRVAYVTLETGVLISRQWINFFFFKVMSAFSAEKTNPESLFFSQSERRASLSVHRFEKSILLWYYGSAYQLFIVLVYLRSFKYRTCMQGTVCCRLQLELVWLTDS